MEVERIKEQLGFHDLALVPAKRLDAMASVFMKRKEAGEMLSIEPEDINARLDPAGSLPSAKSIFVAFEQVPFTDVEPESKKGYGRLASFSRDTDYHLLLNEKMARLEEYLKSAYPEVEYYRQVDTGPLYERGFAAMTGKGYIGRNGSFIHSRLGSYVAIGLLLTNLEGGEAYEMSGDCGDCRACVDACPGGAIEFTGILHPGRCRSWITQKRGELTEGERAVMADWLYGCDVCQMVCPKNKGIEAVYESRDPVHHICLDGLEEESNRSFKQRYGRLSGSWRGKKQWVKNAAYIRRYFNERKK